MLKRKFMCTALVLGALFLGVLASLPLVAQEPAKGPFVVLESLDGVVRQVKLEGFSLARMDTDVARVHFPSVSTAPARDSGFVLELLNGDRVRGEALYGGEESLRLQIVGGAKIDFKIEAFRSLFSLDQLGREAELSAPETGDRLWRKVGTDFDRIDGLLVGFGSDGLLFEGQLGEREYPWGEVAALWIESLGGPSAKVDTAGPRVAVDLVGGSRLRAIFLGVADGAVKLRALDGADITLSLDAVLEIDLDDARLRFVSALPFESLGSSGLFGDEFGMRYPVRRDASVLGGPLMANGVRYAHGLGVHAPSHLALDWAEGGFLRGLVGLDDSARRTATGGSVIFRIRLDGEVAYESAERSSAESPVTLPALDLTGKKRIEFEVDEASGSVMGDRADWLDLRITAE